MSYISGFRSPYDEIRGRSHADMRKKSCKILRPYCRPNRKCSVKIAAKPIPTSPVSPVNTEWVDDLIKCIANRITFMEMTLAKMEPQTRGYKQLTKSIEQIRDNLKANGYEVVDMLNKPYVEGMTVIVSNYVPKSESLPIRKKIIINVIKPQINHNGVKIQTAEVVIGDDGGHNVTEQATEGENNGANKNAVRD